MKYFFLICAFVLSSCSEYTSLDLVNNTDFPVKIELQLNNVDFMKDTFWDEENKYFFIGEMIHTEDKFRMAGCNKKRIEYDGRIKYAGLENKEVCYDSYKPIGLSGTAGSSRTIESSQNSGILGSVKFELKPNERHLIYYDKRRGINSTSLASINSMHFEIENETIELVGSDAIRKNVSGIGVPNKYKIKIGSLNPNK